MTFWLQRVYTERVFCLGIPGVTKPLSSPDILLWDLPRQRNSIRTRRVYPSSRKRVSLNFYRNNTAKVPRSFLRPIPSKTDSSAVFPSLYPEETLRPFQFDSRIACFKTMLPLFSTNRALATRRCRRTSGFVTCTRIQINTR